MKNCFNRNRFFKLVALLFLMTSFIIGSFTMAYGETESEIAYINSHAADQMYLVYDYRSGDCYLSSNMYMLRRRAFLDGMDWTGIRKDTNPLAYDGGDGSLRKTAAFDDGSTYNSMKLDYYFTYGSRTYNVRDAKLPTSRVEKINVLCKLLDEHPEGIAVHGYAYTVWGSWPHSVLLTHYDRTESGDIQFYAVDSAYNTVSNSTAYGGWNSSWEYFQQHGVRKLEETQNGSIDNIYSYKYIANVTPRQVETAVASRVWERLYGAGRYDTMEAIVEEGFHHKGGTVIIASGTTFKDALSASGLAGLFDAPVLITDGNKLSEETASLLNNLAPSKIYIAGGAFAVSEEVVNTIGEITQREPERIYGSTSCGTSAQLALAGKGRWSTEHTAVIATNGNFKDALSVAPIAYAKGYPIFLVDKGKNLSEEVLSAMNEIEVNNVIIVGGASAVGLNVEAQLQANGIGIRERLYGSNGVETSAIIATWGIDRGLNPNKMGVATSQNFPDALAGAAFCGHNNSVLILADDKAIANATFPARYKDQISIAYVFGGESAVGMRTWNALVACTN